MFDSFRDKNKPKELTSLDLGTPAPRPKAPEPVAAAAPVAKPEVKAAAQPQAPQACVAQTMTLELAQMHFIGARRKFDEMVKSEVKPEILYYVVFPQPGLVNSLTTTDGSKTIVPVFNSKPMADAYIAGKKLGAVAAAVRFEKLAERAEHWVTTGINSYALNVCCRCSSLSFYPIAEMQSEDAFLLTWRTDVANRRQFAESYGRNTSTVLATNSKQARVWLEGIRDHIDPANPYLHWMIALLAGMNGDMEANAASIKRMEQFGPPFVGKLQGTSFDPGEAGSQFTTMPEAMVGLGISLGYIDPSKMAHPPKPPDA